MGRSRPDSWSRGPSGYRLTTFHTEPKHSGFIFPFFQDIFAAAIAAAFVIKCPYR